jgi:hypothetical protein
MLRPLTCTFWLTLCILMVASHIFTKFFFCFI